MNPDSSNPLMCLNSVSLTLGGKPVLQELTLSLNPGQVLAILGPNGAGKSSLLKLMSGEIAPACGSVIFDGKPLAEWPRKTIACRLAALPQHSRLSFPFSVREVVGLSRGPRKEHWRTSEQYVQQVLQDLDLTEQQNLLYTQLSGGQQRRVQLARVLAQISDDSAHPKLLLLDEPAAAFDLAHQQSLQRLVRALSQHNVSVAMVVHDINTAIAVSDQIVVLHAGQLVATGNPTETITESLIHSVFGVRYQLVDAPDNAPRKYLLPTEPRT